MPEGQVSESLSTQVSELTKRVSALEEAAKPAPRQQHPPVQPVFFTAPRARPERPAPAKVIRPDVPRRTREPVDIEDLLGGKVLAWLGGGAVLLGLVFLFAVAITNGWIGEAARTIMGGTASAGLTALGVWLHQKRARTDAALAATATGLAGLFLTATVAAQVYELVPALVAVGLALAVGALATTLAISWRSQGIAALGLLGGLLAPVLAGAAGEGGTLAPLLVASAAAAAVVIRYRWGWLAAAAFAVVTPQWVAWMFDQPKPGLALLVLCGFGIVGFGTAVGYELRVPSTRLAGLSAFLVCLNGVALAVVGWFALAEIGNETAGKVLLGALAAAHIGLGLRPGRLAQMSNELGLVLLSLGVVIADIAFSLAVSGLVLSAGLAIVAVGFAAAQRRVRDEDDMLAVRIALGGHLGLVLLHVLTIDARPDLVAHSGGVSATAAGGVVLLAAACMSSARLTRGHEQLEAVLDLVAMAAIAYLTAITLDGVAVAVAFAAEACALAAIERKTRAGTAGLGALAFASGALLHASVIDSTPSALLDGLDDPGQSTIALGAATLALAACARSAVDKQLRRAITVGAATAGLYLASVLVVTLFASADVASSAFDLSVGQQAQVALSVFWSLVGLGTLVTGLLRDSRELRWAGLGVLLVAVAKVFMFDLTALSSIYRVVSLVALGALMLLGALAWQRVRPAPVEDMREAAEGVR